MRWTAFYEGLAVGLLILAMVTTPFGVPHTDVVALVGVGFAILGRR